MQGLTSYEIFFKKRRILNDRAYLVYKEAYYPCKCCGVYCLKYSPFPAAALIFNCNKSGYARET